MTFGLSSKLFLQYFDLFQVCGVVGRAELLSATAFLGALLYYVHHRYQQKGNGIEPCILFMFLFMVFLIHSTLHRIGNNLYAGPYVR